MFLRLPIMPQIDSPTKGFHMIYPKSLQEIKESPYEKFLIKVEASYCPPCVELREFIDSKAFVPDSFVPVYVVEIDGPERSFVREICDKIECRTLPYCYVTDRSLKKIDIVNQFNKTKFIQLIKKNFD